MKNNSIFFFRLVAWTILVSLESVIGLPWLSLWLSGEWLMGFSPNTELISLFMLAVIMASVYALPLTVSGLAIIIIWFAWKKYRRSNGIYLVYLVCTVLLIGVITKTKLSWIISLSTIISWLIFFKISGVSLIKKLWQKNDSIFLDKRVR
ncbi:MAG: hypothetical protein A2383_03290 [Candidatus Pacebacteria bacterium RIFOXYB1_FULL_39_46]|nr:MAG: hypothetical protein A2182_01335 [Candidatus Pacebacteria bacterium RIFOXYA1_FULL_38_18]OGJ38442.1 MAG: hypothetical protein A2383_03290 [Candidatus Pacebacteria bacterium RIFOXYB1_FULL_39_46]OGJ40302.1 MAG: hypothetical protein A2411_03430 [Candidatus Pacebacteria bacterium RIFOXYC1_FULL_39_21]OGJ40875.1 MAG: hypothetical protein A2582_02170 [Candidatus Pacebacteria bacterium RIFOXYD1_FULL_39_27]